MNNTVECPQCHEPVVIDISKCVDELAEVYKCPKCGFEFRWVEK